MDEVLSSALAVSQGLPVTALPQAGATVSGVHAPGGAPAAVSAGVPKSGTIPISVVSIQAGTFPAGTIPAGTIPAGIIPAGPIPADTILISSISSGTIPKSTIPAITIPSVTIPKSTIPKSTIPKTTIQLGTVPEGTVSESSDRVSGLVLEGSQVRLAEASQTRHPIVALTSAKAGLSGLGAVGELDSSQLQRKSYLSVTQARPTLQKHDLTLDEGDQCFVVPKDILTNTSPLWEDLIVGNFPESAPHIAKIHVIVNKIWTFGNKSIKIDAHVVNSTTIKFRIRDKAIRERVLRRGMWNIANIPMMVSNFGPVSEESQPALQKMPMWIEIKKIPPPYFSWKGISFLSSAVGEPKRLHPETELCRKFDEAKVFVEVDLTKPLKESFRFKSQEGEISEVLYSYPWLPPRCSICKKWGHFEKLCHQKLRPGKETTILSRNTQVQGNSTGISEISVAAACASITTATQRPADIQRKQTLPHPVCEDTDAGGRVTSPLGAPLVEKASEHTNHNQQDIGIPSLPATPHPVGGATDEGGVEEQRRYSNSKEEWIRVSPKKTTKAITSQETPEFTVSPSRFVVLDRDLAENAPLIEIQPQGEAQTGTSAAEDIDRIFPPLRVTRSFNRSTQNASRRAIISTKGGKKKKITH